MQVQLKKQHSRYSKYKHTGKPWLGDMPEEWSLLPLKRVVSKKITDGPHTTPQFVDEGIPFISVEAINSDGSIDFSHRRGNIEPSLHKEYCVKCKPQKNDILLVKSGSTTGKTALVKVDFDFSVWSPLALIRANGKMMDFQFLCFYLQSFIFQSQVQLFWTFGTQPNIGMGSIEKLNVLFPRIDQQKVISKYLDEKTILVNSMIEKKQRQIIFLKEKRSALINRAVTRGIGEHVEMKESGVEWIGKVPKNWNVRKLIWNAKKIGSGTTPKSGSEEFYYNGEINWIITGDLNDGFITESSKKITKQAFLEHSTLKIYPKNSVVMAMYGASIGKLAIMKIEACTNQACCVIQANKNMDFKFCYFWLLGNRKNIINLAYGGGQPNISQDTVRNLRIPTPPIEEQREIVSFIEFETQKIDSALKKIEQSVVLLGEYKTSLVSSLVTGELKVT